MNGSEVLPSDVLVSSDDDRRRVAEMLRCAEAPAPPFWEPGVGEQILVPVAGAEIRVFHFPAHEPGVQRPVVMAPGFGATPQGFQDFYEALRGKVDLYYVETREKPSSRILDRRADMSVGQSARDIAHVLGCLGLGRDFVLMAPCWGASIVLEGLIQGTLAAPTIVLADPMHTLWFPKWVLRLVSPILPVGAVRAMRPLLARAMLGGMEEPTQKERALAFVYGADVWKWKKSAEAARDFELFGRLGGISREIFVLNGTTDRIHDQSNYPRIAREMPGGRFLFMPTDERNRERLFGVAALEFARVSAADGLPESLARFEKKIR